MRVHYRTVGNCSRLEIDFVWSTGTVDTYGARFARIVERLVERWDLDHHVWRGNWRPVWVGEGWQRNRPVVSATDAFWEHR